MLALENVTTSAAYPWHVGTDPDTDADPAIFVSDFQVGNLKIIFF